MKNLKLKEFFVMNDEEMKNITGGYNDEFCRNNVTCNSQCITGNGNSGYCTRVDWNYPNQDCICLAI